MITTGREAIIHFLGEQEGVPERELKAALSRLFECDARVRRAYLVRVRYGVDHQAHVALALVAAEELRADVLKDVQGVFRSRFSIGQHLDILFASAVQETEISRVCRPFFGLIAG